jgi:hypothetical protein
MSEPNRWRESGAFFIGAFFGALATGAAALLMCAISVNYERYVTRYNEERRAVEPVLRDDPTFKTIEIVQVSDGGILLAGKVPTDADRNRLREVVSRAIAKTHTDEAMRGVSVEESR